MTALLVEAPAVRIPATVRFPAPAAPWVRVERSAAKLNAADAARLAPAADMGQLYWTRRGLAVMLALVALMVGVMAVTLVAAFLSVSNEPLPATAASQPLVSVVGGA